MTATEQRLEAIMRNIFDDDSLSLTRALSADDVEAWDSLAHVHLIVATEKEFKISIPNAAVVSLKNVGDLIDLVDSLAAR